MKKTICEREREREREREPFVYGKTMHRIRERIANLQ